MKLKKKKSELGMIRCGMMRCRLMMRCGGCFVTVWKKQSGVLGDFHMACPKEAVSEKE